jgi:hypothetical protein
MNKNTHAEMLAYHNGYILALEDVLNDHDALVRSGNLTASRLALQVRGSLEDARRSREALLSQEVST